MIGQQCVGEERGERLQEQGDKIEMIAEQTSRSEAFRYLGYRGAAPDEVSEALMEDCIRELCTKLSPRFFARTYPLQVTEEELAFSCFHVKSRDLKKNLKGCHSVILFGATLGAGVDFLLRRYAVLDMSRAAVMQAASAAMIEAFCNLENSRLEKEYRKKRQILCPRFSPGYGDFPLAFQEKFALALELEKTVGITLTEGFLMMPSKSVTAVIGIREETECSGKGTVKTVGSKCRNCNKTDCLYRKP